MFCLCGPEPAWSSTNLCTDSTQFFTYDAICFLCNKYNLNIFPPLYDIDNILFMLCKRQIFEYRYELAWAPNIGKQHGIIVVNVLSDTANGKRGRKDKLIVGYERGGNYKRNNAFESSKYS